MKLTAIFLFLVGAVGLANAQPVVVSGDPTYNADSPYNRLYNTNTVTTIKGTVSGLEIAPPMKGMTNAISLLVKSSTTGKTWHVDVGPEWYVNNQHVRIKVKDHVSVTGSRVNIDGHDVILAEQIVKSKNVLALRRPAGRPYWDAVYTEAPSNNGIDLRSVQGQVIKIDSFVDGTNGTTQRWTLHTDNGDVVVALAPDWFMQRQAAQVALGDQVNVNLFAPVGVPTQPAGQGLLAPPVVFATSVNFGQRWMVIRAGNGTPMWYGTGGN